MNPNQTPDGPDAGSSGDDETLHGWLATRARALAEQYRARDDGDPPLVHVPTGIPRLDAAGLLEPGILTAVGSHAGDGKSAFALQLAEGAARAGLDVQAYFLEDPGHLVADRELAKRLGVSAFKLRRLSVDAEAAAVASRLSAAVRGAEEWARRVRVSDRLMPTDDLMEDIRRRWTDSTRLVLVDYAQAFDAEGDERSVERVIARLAWRLNTLAKGTGAAVVLFSQVRREVLDRGRRWYENWRFKNQGETPTAEAVEGFRPNSGDLQWSSALQQRAKQVVYLFRPGNWQRSLGANVPDDVMELSIDKGNFGPNKEILRLGWDGPQARVFDRKG